MTALRNGSRKRRIAHFAEIIIVRQCQLEDFGDQGELKELEVLKDAVLDSNDDFKKLIDNCFAKKIKMKVEKGFSIEFGYLQYPFIIFNKSRHLFNNHWFS